MGRFAPQGLNSMSSQRASLAPVSRSKATLEAATRRNFRCEIYSVSEDHWHQRLESRPARIVQSLHEELAHLESNVRELVGEEGTGTGTVRSLVALYEPSAAAIPEATRRVQNERELSQLSDAAHQLQRRHAGLGEQLTHLQTSLQQKQGLSLSQNALEITGTKA